MKVLKIVLVLSILYVFSGCKAVTVSPEMKDFLSTFGDTATLDAGMKKYGKKGVFPKEFNLCNLVKPVVTKKEVKEGITYYTAEARVEECDRSEKAKGTIRIFILGWKDKKIVSFKWAGPKSGKVEY